MSLHISMQVYAAPAPKSDRRYKFSMSRGRIADTMELPDGLATGSVGCAALTNAWQPSNWLNFCHWTSKLASTKPGTPDLRKQLY